MSNPGQTTLGLIRTQARRRADMVNSQFLSDSDFNDLINKSYYELYDLLVQKFGDDYYVATPLQITTDGTNNQYALPDGTLYSGAPAFYKLLGVDVALGPSARPDEFITLKKFNRANRNRASFPNRLTVDPRFDMRYRLSGNNLWITPTPQANQLIQIWYAPRLTSLVNDSDIVDGVSGWEEYIILDVAIKALTIQETDVQVLLAEKQAIISRIESAAENRDAASPETVADVIGQGLYPYDGRGGPGDDWSF